MVDKQLPKLILTDELIQGFEQAALDMVKFNDFDEAKEFVFKVWPEIETDQQLSVSQPEDYKRLERIFYLSSFILIAQLTDKKVISLFERGLVWYFKDMVEDVDLWEIIKTKLVTLFTEDRDPFKAKIRKAMLENDEVITSGKILRDDKVYLPTIKQWLLDYTTIVGAGVVSSIKMNQYFTDSKNYQSLKSEVEKKRVRILITVYEQLKKSSLEPDSIEETVLFDRDGQKIIFTAGRFEDYDPKIVELIKKFRAAGLIPPEEKEFPFDLNIKPSGPAAKKLETQELTQPSKLEQEIFLAYQGDQKQNQAISKEAEGLSRKFKDNILKLREEFFASVQKNNIIKTVAILRILAQKDDLSKFLQQDEKLNKFLVAIWEKQYGKVVAEEFIKNPQDFKFVRLFLRYILEQRLGLSVSDAARIGLQIGNIFVARGQKEYNRMAYFDITKKSFDWFE